MEKGEVGEQEGTIRVNFNEGNKAKLLFKYIFFSPKNSNDISLSLT